ncbi:MAG TPA: Phenylacetic acid catabolic protein [Candidatus Thermoplasmatota archaeon]|jgi:benzoyl-CoA 2,3-dioxygenase component B|nr:Phenylacetic acid catabolic protein [Candidatus Thermoplasmatota archaeon]
MAKAASIQNFDDWVQLFQAWQKDIGFPVELLGDFKFEAKFGELDHADVEFGDYAGQPKWEQVMAIPHQSAKDSLLNLIVYQGDTEFASVEQQRHLVKTAPSEYDLKSIMRVMSEEQRHGWQMCYLMVKFFGKTGAVEAQKQLERRSWDNQRLLGSFNVPVKHWLDFYTYTEFVDRDGKYQLKMLSHSGFAPLARSMGPMLKEESFHLGTGHTGLKRVVRAGKVPLPIIQRYFNKWVPTAFDLFGVDNSTSARMFYVYGLKGRFDEGETSEPADLDALNERARLQYYEECKELVRQLNEWSPAGQKLLLPDIKFHRGIGTYKGQRNTVEGEPFQGSEKAYEDYLAAMLPTDDDERVLQDLYKSPDWVAARA